jgi:serine/threonine protein kinase
MRDKDGSTVLPFVNGKPCFLYKYREGKVFSVNSDADVKRAAEFIRDFHSQNITSAIRGEVVFEEFKKELNIYRSQKVKEGIDKDFKEIFQGLNELVDKVYEALPFLERMAKPIITKGGLVHSDFTPDNVLVNGEKLELIDFDSIKENGMQIIDLLQFASKSGIAEDKNRLSNFFNTYSDRSEHPPEDLRAFQALLLMFSVKALLSTLYYTYDVGKADVEWVKRNSMQTLEPLYKCATSLHRELIP